ncbi:fibronectin-binding autotransporter adhesin [Rhizobium sp. BK650]|uniref:autotransporter family protein n=1 Tax=Rhizobium sp. BK650 TaxID=2586990 RepID=UPI0017C2C59E|nr:autotransporter outer membrane beta-barrel domain-containing protein [Rhizobium sp. BK650]MBB3656882.1 fibronectin-binding autotransporter adhesin [Rhizobium sp. BK650]
MVRSKPAAAGKRFVTKRMSISTIALAFALLTGAHDAAEAANECGAPVAGAVTCAGNNYPSPGISYSVTSSLTLTLNNPALVAVKATTGQGAVFVSGSSTNDIVINALMFQSIQTSGTLSNGVGAVNSGTGGSTIIRMDTGTVIASGSSPLPGALLSSITNATNSGNALITLNGGQASNTGGGQGVSAQNAGTGNATVTMNGGLVSSTTGTAMRAIITNAASSGAAGVAISGGTMMTASGTGVLSQSERGSAGITMTAGTVTVQGGANSVLNAVVNNAAGTGTASIAMSGGTVTNNGSGDGLFANNKGTGTYNIGLTGGTVTGGSGTGAAIHAAAASGGTIAIGPGAVVNAGASGIALSQTGGAAAITTAGTVTGNVNLSAASNMLDITGGAINGNINGGGNTALSFDLGTSNSFTYGSPYSIGGVNSVAMNSGSAEIDGSFATNTLAVNGGRLILNGAGTASSGASVSGGTFVVGDAAHASATLTGPLDVLAGGRLQGYGMIVGDIGNAGIIAPGNSIGTLTISGNYAGNGGTLEIETVLGNDASATDRLVVTGNTSGSTNLKVINVGGGGAQTVEGIKVVDVGGASNGTFSLLGNYVFQGDQAVVGGAYAYRLYKGGVSTPGDGDWYLRSHLINDPTVGTSPLYAPGVPLYEAYAGVLQSFNQLGTLQQRTGGRSWMGGVSVDANDEGARARGIWGRIEASHNHLEPGTSTTGTDYGANVWKLQTGVDGALAEGAAGTLIGGVSVQYGTVSADVSSLFGRGDIDTTGYGLGGTLTWYGNCGLYVDAQGQLTWYDSDLRSDTLNRTLANGNSGFGYAFSIEAGQKIGLGPQWSLTPQAQLSYSSVRFDDFTDPYSAAVSLGDGDALVGRLGLSADYDDQWKDGAGRTSRSGVYGIANLYYDFLDGSDVDVSGTRLVSENRALWGGLGLGGSYSWSDERYSINGEAFARTSLQDFGDSYSIGGKLTFNVKW